MLQINNAVFPSPEQWKAAITGMRHPMLSYAASDSYFTHIENPDTLNTAAFQFFLGDSDLKLMRRLCKAGSDHRKFMRMLPVFADVTAPRYWWAEYDTYKVGTVANSTSTMHKLTHKRFALSDFSYEDCDEWTRENVCRPTVDALNMLRNKYLETHDKTLWRNMIQLLPASYNQRRTLFLNYEVLLAIRRARKDHKLSEWKTFCDWIDTVPYFLAVTLFAEDTE
nr:MAG TPA: hypothetical protein [Caudoviricetes sp.]